MGRLAQRLCRVASLGLCFWFVGCGATSTITATDEPAAVEVAEPASQQMEVSLDFFATPVPESTQPPATSTVVDEPTSVPTTAPSISAAASPAPAVTPTTAGAAGDSAEEPSDPQISISPSSVVLAIERDVVVSGTGLGPDLEVLIIACELPGQAVSRDMSLDQIGARIINLDLGSECDFDNSATELTSTDGSFEASVLVDIGPATVILAGAEGGATSLFIPLYLDS